jgi:hypothetical protein
MNHFATLVLGIDAAKSCDACINFGYSLTCVWAWGDRYPYEEVRRDDMVAIP